MATLPMEVGAFQAGLEELNKYVWGHPMKGGSRKGEGLVYKGRKNRVSLFTLNI